MSKPIKETPVLRGKDASLFLSKMEQNKTRKIDPREVASIRSNAQKLRAVLRPH